MPVTDSTTLPVLVVGATGSLGSKVVDELLGRGKNVRALVRPASDAGRLESRGVEIARGDMLDVNSLVAAMNGADAVITTAAGYTRGGKNADDIDTVGNANLAEAAHRTGIRRFVLTSILTSDQTPDVPHFWHKKLAEDKLEQLGVPFVALRPGAFLDQVARQEPLDNAGARAGHHEAADQRCGRALLRPGRRRSATERAPAARPWPGRDRLVNVGRVPLDTGRPRG
ncbi:SDR family oxidoreductase [Streptomyces massasporeus]|uniref:SDR family oxidoreductase n=1 Tax=Streptomyces massasporeus TaxID=67324 RepID=UPI0033AA08CB